MACEKSSRRKFLGRVALGIAASGVRSVPSIGNSMVPAMAHDMPYRTLGRSGEKVSLLGLGGYHIGIQKTEAESIRIIQTAIDNGVNFLDNCWDYNDGQSEIRMGLALKNGYRQKVFLMTKIDGQVKDGCA